MICLGKLLTWPPEYVCPSESAATFAMSRSTRNPSSEARAAVDLHHADQIEGFVARSVERTKRFIGEVASDGLSGYKKLFAARGIPSKGDRS